MMISEAGNYLRFGARRKGVNRGMSFGYFEGDISLRFTNITTKSFILTSLSQICHVMVKF